MIDTINICLNNVKEKYPLTRTRFEAQSRVGETLIQVDQSSGEVFSNSKIRAVMYHDSGTIIPLTKRSKLHVASSSYAVVYQYNIAQDYISFEFSVPKYVWGTNLVQYVRFFTQEPGDIYLYFMEFIKAFFVKNTLDVIDLKDVEITRIDFCYNQFFNTKSDALFYLDEQKLLARKHERNSAQGLRTYDASFMYVTGRYSFKIYHKGTEFRKNDRNELLKKWPKNITHSLDDLSDAADRILRYEITFRKAQIDYLFNEHQLYKPYLKWMFNDKRRSDMRRTNRDYYDSGMRFCERAKSFIFKEPKEVNAVQNGQVYFSKTVFCMLHNFFWDYVKKYQLSRRLGLGEISMKIEQANAKRDKAVSKGLRDKLSHNKNSLVLMAMLLQTESFENIKKSGFLSRSTYFLYKRQLTDLGLSSEGRLTEIEIPPQIDYGEYKAVFGRYHTR